MKVLVLKTVESDMSAYGGFVWPRFGKVTCPDWNPEPICGGGLHGLLWGEGMGELLWGNLKNKVWLVLEVDSEKIVDLNGNVKFPECEVIYAGNKEEAIDKILERNPKAACAYANKTVEDYGTAVVGYFGTAIAGNYGQAVAGYFGKAIVGAYGVAQTKNYGTAQAGNFGKIEIDCWDAGNYKKLVGYVGEDGIEANVMYKAVWGKFEKV